MNRPIVRRIRYISGWCFVRPRRWLFWRMIGETELRWKWVRQEFGDESYWQCPNFHWWIAYRTIFKFFKWLYWDGWRPLCKWGERTRLTYPWYARAVHKLGQTTAGFAICGGECFHCASDDGDPVALSDDDTGTTFRLEETWTVGTQNGTDHRFRGTTICPACGYESEYEDGSL